MFNRMYVGTYSKAACFHALNKSIQFNEILISLQSFWSRLPNYRTIYDKYILSDKESVIVNIFDDIYYCRQPHMNTFSFYSIYVDTIMNWKTEETSLIDYCDAIYSIIITPSPILWRHIFKSVTNIK